MKKKFSTKNCLLPSFMSLKTKKLLKSFEKRDDLVLKEVRFQKKFPKVKIGKIGMDYKHLSTLIIPILAK